jgi:hypothetical protein
VEHLRRLLRHVLALEVLRSHPQGIRSVILDSIVPPQQHLQVGFWTWAALGYEHLLSACDRQAACHAAYPNLRKELSDALNALEATPVTVTITTPAGPKQVIIDVPAGELPRPAQPAARGHPGRAQDGPRGGER